MPAATTANHDVLVTSVAHVGLRAGMPESQLVGRRPPHRRLAAWLSSPPLSLGDRVEQVSVDEDHGALRSRLHHHGQIVGRDRDRVYVVFDQGWQYLVNLPPQHLRLLDTPEDH